MTRPGPCVDCRRKEWEDYYQYMVEYAWLAINFVRQGLGEGEEGEKLSKEIFPEEVNEFDAGHYNAEHPWVRNVFSRCPLVRPGVVVSVVQRVPGERGYYHHWSE